MKNIFKYTYLALVGMVAMIAASCSDDYKYDGRGEWDATDGYANIYFAITDSTLELDPADPTIVTVAVSRRNTQGALTVPFEIHENTDSVFTVSDAVFADGEAEAEITLSFPKAEIGKPYTLEITTSDPEVVSQYSAGAIYTIEVTRVKWNDVGFYYTDDDKTEKSEKGWAMLTDVFIGSVFNTGNLTYPVKIQERDDQEGVFRIINAYGEAYPYNEPGDYDESKDYYIIINATDPEKVYISPSLVNLGVDWGYGNFYARNYAGYYEEAAQAAAEAGDAEKEKEYLDKIESNGWYGKYENGKIIFPAGAFFVTMENEGHPDSGWSSSAAFVLVINPDLDPHNADMTSEEDFEWEEVYAGNFASNQMATQKDGVKLYKGTCINTTDSCDVRFAKEYGTAYKIESPYADGYNLYFAVDSTGAVTLPEDLQYQNTGMKAVGADVYAVISPAASTFTERVVTLKTAFQTKPDKDGNYTEYGSAEEVLSYITWTKVGTGTYTYTVMFDDPLEDSGYEIYQRDDKPDTYKVADWFYGGDFVFTWDGKDGNGVTVSPSFTGYVDPDYGNVYVSDIPTWNNGLNTYDDFPCTYDADTQIFELWVVYYDVTAYWGFGAETLKVDWGASAARKGAARSYYGINLSKKKQSGLEQYSCFGNGTKANVKSKKVMITPSNASMFVR